MMERSSKFLSISGMSGVLAGSFAIAGAITAHFIITGELSLIGNLLYDLVIVAILVLIGAVSSGLYFSARKAKKSNSKLWMPVTMQITKDVSVPLITGGVFCIILIYQHATHLIAASMLIFYGLSLIAAGARTYRDIKILGACDILLGLLAGIFINNGLLFWTIGFGVLHIVYGIVIYNKYDKKIVKNG